MPPSSNPVERSSAIALRAIQRCIAKRDIESPAPDNRRMKAIQLYTVRDGIALTAICFLQTPQTDIILAIIVFGLASLVQQHQQIRSRICFESAIKDQKTLAIFCDNSRSSLGRMLPAAHKGTRTQSGCCCLRQPLFHCICPGRLRQHQV